MAYSDALFDLIHSLQVNEKRYFKLFNSLHEGEKTQNALFDELNKQKNYDEDALREAFKGAKMANQFSVAKNALYNKVLKGMEVFHMNTSPRMKLLSDIKRVQFLFSKGLFSQARKLIRQSMKQAEKVEDLFVMQLLLRTEEDIIAQEGFDKKELDQLFAMQMNINDRIQDYVKLKYFENSAMSYIRKHGRYTDDYVGWLRNLKETQQIEEMQPVDKTSRARQYVGLQLYYFILQDKKKIIHYSELFLHLFDDHPGLSAQHFTWHLSAVNNLLIAYREYDVIGKAPDVLKKMIAMEPLARKQSDVLYKHYRYHRLTNFFNHALVIGDFKQVSSLIEEYEVEVSKLKGGEYRKVIEPVLFNVAHALFILGDYNKALDYVEQLFEYSKLDKRSTFLRYILVLRILAHYQLGNDLILSSLVDASIRKIRQINGYNNMEIEILKLMKRLGNASTTDKVNELLVKFKTYADSRMDDRSECETMENTIFYPWLISQIEGTSIKEVISTRGYSLRYGKVK